MRLVKTSRKYALKCLWFGDSAAIYEIHFYNFYFALFSKIVSSFH